MPRERLLVAGEREAGRRRMMADIRTAVAVTLKVSEEERAAIEVAAERAGKPVTQWARDKLIAAARA